MKKLLICAIFTILCCFTFSTVYADDTDQISINTPEGLISIADDPYGKYILTADIDMSGVEWTPLAFYGRFDGSGHVIYNLKVGELGETYATTVDGNDKEYETYFAGLFSVVKDAVIKDLTLLNVDIHISTDKNAFVAVLAGFMENTTVSGCSISGRVYLYQTNRMCGVSGIVGFGYGSISGCSADVELVFIDGDTSYNCEEFLGGILACGYADIDSCSISLKGYASVDGFVHNGGIVGMYYVYTSSDKAHAGYVSNCSVDADISFYEDNTNRRAYCSAYIGETLNYRVTVSGNTTVYFKNGEIFDYSAYLLPEKCDSPIYDSVVHSPSCTEFGYTAYTCEKCGYSYNDDYAGPVHTPGEWVTAIEPTYMENGMSRLYCSVCKQLLEEKEIPKLVYVSFCRLDHTELDLSYRSSEVLNVEILPSDATDTGYVWSTSDDRVATVSKYGDIYATGPGTAVITCASEDGYSSDTCTVTVTYAWWQWMIVILLFGWIWY